MIKKKFYFFSPSHPVAYSRPPGRVSAPHRLRTTDLEDFQYNALNILWGFNFFIYCIINIMFISLFIIWSQK